MEAEKENRHSIQYLIKKLISVSLASTLIVGGWFSLDSLLDLKCQT